MRQAAWGGVTSAPFQPTRPVHGASDFARDGRERGVRRCSSSARAEPFHARCVTAMQLPLPLRCPWDHVAAHHDLAVPKGGGACISGIHSTSKSAAPAARGGLLWLTRYPGTTARTGRPKPSHATVRGPFCGPECRRTGEGGGHWGSNTQRQARGWTRSETLYFELSCLCRWLQTSPLDREAQSPLNAAVQAGGSPLQHCGTERL